MMTPTQAVDVVAVFDSNLNQLYEGARAMRASVAPSSKLMEHPIENGATKTDFRIILPIEITLSVVLRSSEYRDVYEQVRNSFNNGDSVIIQTRASTYENMMLMDMPHEESPDNIDTLIMNLKYKEVLEFNTQFLPLPASAVKNKTKQSTKNRGQQKGSTPANEASQKQSLLARAFN